jgi:hypothetical protein
MNIIKKFCMFQSTNSDLFFLGKQNRIKKVTPIHILTESKSMSFILQQQQQQFQKVGRRKKKVGRKKGMSMSKRNL